MRVWIIEHPSSVFRHRKGLPIDRGLIAAVASELVLVPVKRALQPELRLLNALELTAFGDEEGDLHEILEGR